MRTRVYCKQCKCEINILNERDIFYCACGKLEARQGIKGIEVRGEAGKWALVDEEKNEIVLQDFEKLGVFTPPLMDVRNPISINSQADAGEDSFSYRRDLGGDTDCSINRNSRRADWASPNYEEAIRELAIDLEQRIEVLEKLSPQARYSPITHRDLLVHLHWEMGFVNVLKQFFQALMSR